MCNHQLGLRRDSRRLMITDDALCGCISDKVYGIRHLQTGKEITKSFKERKNFPGHSHQETTAGSLRRWEIIHHMIPNKIWHFFGSRDVHFSVTSQNADKLSKTIWQWNRKNHKILCQLATAQNNCLYKEEMCIDWNRKCINLYKRHSRVFNH